MTRLLAHYTTAVGAARRAADRLAEANALRDLGRFHRMQGDYPAARVRLTEALTIYEELEHQEGSANTRTELVVVFRMQGRYRLALEYVHRLLEFFEQVGDQRGVNVALCEMSTLRCHLGEPVKARESALAALRLCHDLGDPVRDATTLRALGYAELRCDLLDDAETSLNRSLRFAREANFRIGEADALHFLGMVLGRRGRLAKAEALFHEALEMFAALGSGRGQISAQNDLGNLVRDRDPRLARRYHVRALRMAHAVANELRVAESWEGLGRSLITAGDVAGGLRRLRRALSIYRRIGDQDTRNLVDVIAEIEGRP